VVHDAEEAVAVGREVDSDDFGAFIGDDVEEARVLVREAVVVWDDALSASILILLCAKIIDLVVVPCRHTVEVSSMFRLLTCCLQLTSAHFSSHFACWFTILSMMWMNGS